MTPKRKFSSHGYVHIFHITFDSGVCFYSAADCLVWFTIFCILAVKYKVKVLAICIMLNHFHVEAKFSSRQIMSAMMRELDSWFTRAYNRHYGRSGALFDGKYGSAVKLKEQKIRDNFIYVCNNPVVKKAVRRAEDYRWNFLAYMSNNHPFSEKLTVRDSSRKLRFALTEVRRCRERMRPVGYGFFQGVYKDLSAVERRQILDYIVAQYNVIDYDTIRGMWGGFKKMCAGLGTVSGAEFDLRDDTSEEDYRHHYQMINLARDMGIDLAYGCPKGDLESLVRLFYHQVGATKQEIVKLLHCPYLELFGIQ